jgi:hypothetical protein
LTIAVVTDATHGLPEKKATGGGHAVNFYVDCPAGDKYFFER